MAHERINWDVTQSKETVKGGFLLKFYIASKLENAELVSSVAEVLKSLGWKHTYDWTVHGSVQGEGEARLTEVAEYELNGVRKADIVIVLLPGGRGTHVELGAALALGKRVYIWAETDEYFLHDERTCVFYWDSWVTRVVGDIELLIQTLNPGKKGVAYG